MEVECRKTYKGRLLHAYDTVSDSVVAEIINGILGRGQWGILFVVGHVKTKVRTVY